MFKFSFNAVFLGILSAIYLPVTSLAKFPSSVPELDIPNAHLVAKKSGTIYRGSSPVGHENELAEFDVTDVIIFKNQTSTEVDKELLNLKKSGFTSDHIHHIPFKWKDVGEFKENCEQIVDALKVVTDVLHDSKRKGFIHCTVGEDRTGLLSGLVQQLNRDTDVKGAFEEMCLNGYEAGNPVKPFNVTAIIQSQLTPIYLKMSYLIETGQVDMDHLDRSVCMVDPENDKDFEKNPTYDSKKYRCTPSERFEH